MGEDDKQILVIDEFQSTDVGKYTCIAENELGTAKWSASVKLDDEKKGSGKSSPQKVGSKKTSREPSPSKKQKKKLKVDKKSPDSEQKRSDSVSSSSQSTIPPATPASDYVAD